jgi:hypothetical protein
LVAYPRQGVYECARWGHVAEWLRNGLQNRVHQFNSGRGLHNPLRLRNNCVPSLFLRTSLLPFRFVFVAGGGERLIDDRGGILLHPGNDVAVKVERDADLAVSQPLAGDLGVNVAR